MAVRTLARRLRRLPSTTVCGRHVHVALGTRARLLGLAHLDFDQVGTGLLIPRCSSVHTFGMRFALDLVFLDREGGICSVKRAVPPCRIAADSSAAAVLELPAKSAICDPAQQAEGESFRLCALRGGRCCPRDEKSPASSSARTTPRRWSCSATV